MPETDYKIAAKSVIEIWSSINDFIDWIFNGNPRWDPFHSHQSACLFIDHISVTGEACAPNDLRKVSFLPAEQLDLRCSQRHRKTGSPIGQGEFVLVLRLNVPPICPKPTPWLVESTQLNQRLLHQ